MAEDIQQMIRGLAEDVRIGFNEAREFRSETGERLLRIEKRIASLEELFRGMLQDWTELRAKQRDLERRTLDLERRAE